MGQMEQESKFGCPLCSTPLDREAYINATEALKRKFHQEFQKDEEEFEKKLRRAIDMYHKQIDELRRAHSRSQSDLKNELIQLHSRKVVELTRYHDQILDGSSRQFHNIVRQINTQNTTSDKAGSVEGETVRGGVSASPTGWMEHFTSAMQQVKIRLVRFGNRISGTTEV
jgi:DNA repair exonuclease SbcCD ATPase subunit